MFLENGYGTEENSAFQNDPYGNSLGQDFYQGYYYDRQTNEDFASAGPPTCRTRYDPAGSGC